MRNESNAADTVYHEILKQIGSGEYPKGSRLPSENELCQKYGVSRITIRSALQRLLALGLVETKIGGGTYIKDAAMAAAEFNEMIPFIVLDSRDLWEMLEFRQGIEAMAAHYAAVRATDQELEQLQEIYARMAAAFQENDLAVYSNLDYEFHLFISHIAHNSVLEKVNGILSRFFQNQINESNREIGHTVGFEEHKRILNALVTRNQRASEFYAEEHVGNTIARYRAHPAISQMLSSRRAPQSGSDR